jgi:hypothetical protein
MAEVATVEALVVDELDCLAVVVPDPAVAVGDQYVDSDSFHVENLTGLTGCGSSSGNALRVICILIIAVVSRDTCSLPSPRNSSTWPVLESLWIQILRVTYIERMLLAAQRQQRALRKSKTVREPSYLRIGTRIKIDSLNFLKSEDRRKGYICRHVMECRTPSFRTSAIIIKYIKNYLE